jgi:hypothetical protein
MHMTMVAEQVDIQKQPFRLRPLQNHFLLSSDKVVHLEIQHLNTVGVAQVAQVLLAVLVAADIQVFSLALAQVLHLSLQVLVVAQLQLLICLRLVQQVAEAELVMVEQAQIQHHLVVREQQLQAELPQQVKAHHVFPLQVHLCKVEMVAD